jgi:putative addiction module component (TIGR02574 family)
MTEIAEKLFREALGLSPNERVGLVEELLKSLDEPDPNLDALWAKEAEDRLRAYRAGEIKSHSADEVFAELSRG